MVGEGGIEYGNEEKEFVVEDHARERKRRRRRDRGRETYS